MNKKLSILALLVSVLALPVVFQTNAAQAADDLSNEELHELILDLSDRVETLEAELKTEKGHVATLQKQMTALKNGTNATYGNDVATMLKAATQTQTQTQAQTQNQTQTKTQTQTQTQTRTGGVGICQNGNTAYVDVSSAIEQVQKNGATMGVCTQKRSMTATSANNEGLQAPSDLSSDSDEEDNSLFYDYEAY